MSLSVKVFTQQLPLAGVFRISRGAKTTADVVMVVVSDGEHLGWGEAVPYQRYAESLDSVCQQLWALQGDARLTHSQVNSADLLPAGSARNALDCALWDLRARQQRTTVNQLLGIDPVASAITAQTISLGSLDEMCTAAKDLRLAPLIKVKLDDRQVLEKMRALAELCPSSRFIIDANEAWHIGQLQEWLAPLAELAVDLIEQPLPAEQDDALRGLNSPIALCADESCHTVARLPELVGKYQAVNIKLDKTGGLTEAVALLKAAQQANLQIMLGCMVGSSLAMAPAYALASQAQFIDLDGPILVAEDRAQGFIIQQGQMSPAVPALWGQGKTLPRELELLGN